MAEYISRKAATLAVCEEQESVLFHWHIDDPHITVFAVDIKERIRKIPASDVQPVRHGRWTDDGDCSVCGHCDWDCVESKYFLYCPNCGAKMDLTDN